jgi:hypothetical protein
MYYHFSNLFYHIETKSGTGIFPLDLITGSVLASTIPLIIGILVSSKIKGKNLFIGFIIGALFFLFFDLLKQTSGISEARINNIIEVANYLGFMIGISVFFPLIFSKEVKTNLYIVYVWALLGVGFHSFGEGSIIAYDFLTGETVITLTQVISYSLHKFAEGLAIGILLYETSKEIRDVVISFLLSSTPFIVGLISSLYYPTSELSTIFFSIAAGSTVFLLSYLLTRNKINDKLLLGIMIGLSFIFFAGVLHSI